MACLNVLKTEIKAIEASFPKTHDRLQVVSASVDELTCKFIEHGRKHVIHANITETYPQTPPVWFSESEDPKVAEAVSCLTGTTGLDNHLLYQVKLLMRHLCSQFSLPVPKEVDTMHVSAAAAAEVAANASVAANGNNHGDSSDDSDLGDMEEEDEEEDEEIPLDMEVVISNGCHVVIL